MKQEAETVRQAAAVADARRLERECSDILVATQQEAAASQGAEDAEGAQRHDDEAAGAALLLNPYETVDRS